MVSPPLITETFHRIRHVCDTQGDLGFDQKESSENKSHRSLLSIIMGETKVTDNPASLMHYPAIVQWETQWQLQLEHTDLSRARQRRANPN